MSSVLVEGGVLVTMDPRRRVVREGSVMIEGGDVVAVGRSEAIRRQYHPEIRIDAKGMAVIPGLIDTHVHLAQSLLRGCADDLSLIDWLRKRVWPLQGNFNEGDGKVSAQLAMLEMIKSGTTSFVGVDVVSRYGFDGIASEITRVGMRGILAKTVMDSPGYGSQKSIMHPGLVEERNACIREAKAMMKWNSERSGLVKTWIAPRSLGGCTRELYEEAAELASEYRTGITMHLAEVKEDVKYAEAKYRMTPVEFVEKVGLTGPNVLFAHMVWLSDADIQRVARTKTNVAHCPSSNLKLASGVPKIPEMLEAGVNVGLGCDGAPCNNSHDLIREMKLAAIIQKGRLLDPQTMPAAKVLEMATIDGARAMGLERKVGSIEVGKRGDLAIIDLKKPHLVPYNDVISDIVYAAMGSDVDTVLVDGKVLLKGGIAQTLNEAEVIRSALEHQTQLLARAGVRL